MRKKNKNNVPTESVNQTEATEFRAESQEEVNQASQTDYFKQYYELYKKDYISMYLDAYRASKQQADTGVKALDVQVDVINDVDDKSGVVE